MDEYSYEEFLALNFFLDKDVENFKDLIENLYNEYEDETNFLHILVLFKILNNENVKEEIKKVLRLYEENRFICPLKIVVILIYQLTKYYDDKNNLEKLYTCLLKSTYYLTYETYSEVLNPLVDAVLEAREWLISNLSLSKEEIDTLNFMTLSILEETTFDDVSRSEVEKIFKNYVFLVGELKDYFDKKIFDKYYYFFDFFKQNDLKNNKTILNADVEVDFYSSFKEEFNKFFCERVLKEEIREFKFKKFLEYEGYLEKNLIFRKNFKCNI